MTSIIRVEYLPSHLLQAGFFLRLIFDPEDKGDIHSSEASFHIRTTLRYILEDGNIHNSLTPCS
jgi:hypothetical protein